MTVPEALDGLPRRVAGWAVSRSPAPASMTGISLILSCCAAAWFTAGTRPDDVKGALALAGAYLAASAARLATGPPAGDAAREAVAWADPGLRASPASRADPGLGADRGMRSGSSAVWLAQVCGAMSQFAVYAGLAVGGYAAGWTGMWRLSAAVLILLSARVMVMACSGAGEAAAAEGSWHERLSARFRNQADRPGLGGGWTALIAVAAPVWGPRATLLALLDLGIIATAFALIGRRRDPGTSRHRRAGVHPALITFRDDGVLAAWLGRPVRGHLVPLPPAIAGLAATGVLAVLGLHNLSGILVLTPAVVMLLSAPGSSHPHDGRLDWLVPALLQAGELVYIAALGFAFGAPGPLTFALCALIALRHVARVSPGGRPPGNPRGALGWEGRMLVAGLGGVFGIVTVAYLALTAYLGVLVGLEIIAGCLGAGGLAGRGGGGVLVRHGERR